MIYQTGDDDGMKITAVTVCFNAGDKLMDTVKDTLKQDFDDFEILVKDGGSMDGSVEKLQKYVEETKPAIPVRIVSEKDGGIYDAMNRAVKLAKGEYISFMNCGDRYADSSVLRKTAKRMEETGNKEIYYGDAYFRTVGNVIHMPKEITPSVCYRHIPNHQSCFFKRMLWKDKQLNPKYRIRADYEFFLFWYFEKGVRPVYLGITVADYEGGGYSESKENRKRDAYEHKVVTEKYMTKEQLAKEKAFRVVTLQPVRTFIAQKTPLSKAYDAVKRKIYR
ncbi:MAG: glycosyltransferase [Lachnospiraceae bacterium]|nr:glycosyltransferase [Lachnospiraceae bacterium]